MKLEHNQIYTRYLEVVIDKNGKIMYAVPSHQEKQITLACLINLGFKYGERSGAQGETGYTKTIQHNEGYETLWITVNPQERKAYLYNEWDCGGELWKREYDIPQDVIESESEFVDWLDEKIGDD